MKNLPLQESVKIAKSVRKSGLFKFIAGLIFFSVVSNLVIRVNNIISFENDIGFIIQLFSYSFLILAIIAYSLFIEHRNLQFLGVHSLKLKRTYLIGLLIGFSMMVIIIILNLVINSMSLSSNSNVQIVWTLLIFLGFCVQGFAEELLFKGYFMISIASMSTTFVGIITNSLIFSLNHAINPNVTMISLLNIFLFGLFLSLIFFIMIICIL